MISKSIVIGFHGCDQHTAVQAVEGRELLIAREKKYHWLGQGIYFWEDSAFRAWQWAFEAQKHGRIKEAAVIGAVIDIGNCLNLVDPAGLMLVREAYDTYMELCRVAGQAPQKNKGSGLRARYLDCEVFDTLHRLRAEAKKPKFDSVRAFFVEGKPLYKTSGLREQDHIQVCVRDPGKIIGYFYPRSEDDKPAA